MQNNYDKDGFLVVFKPSGCTSRDVVNKVSKILKTKKVGHTGTLDPIATGILILTIGKYTKLSDYLVSKYKEYEAKFVLGYETDTLDYTGKTTRESDHIPSKEEIKKKIASFKGTYMQEVPIYSAVKINGKKLYEYARSGIDVELPKREVHIKDISIKSIDKNEIEIKCVVSKGTYIRSLIRDIGRSLDTYATMTSLMRTMQGGFKKDDAYTIEMIEKGDYKLLGIDDVLDMDLCILDENLLKKVENGVKLDLPFEKDFLKCIFRDKVIALYKKDGDFYKMFIKF